jgi:hypothetical protein
VRGNDKGKRRRANTKPVQGMMRGLQAGFSAVQCLRVTDGSS